MDSESGDSMSLLHFTHTVLLGACSRLDTLGSVGAMVSEMLLGVVSLSTGSGLARGLKVVSLSLVSIGAVVLGSAFSYLVPDNSKVVPFLRNAYSYVFSKESGDVGLGLLETRGEASEMLGWMLPMLIVVFVILAAILVTWAGPGGSAWSAPRLRAGRNLRIAPGPAGLPVLGCAKEMQGNAHRKLASLAWNLHAQKLMAFSVGCTRIVITSDPSVARDMLLGSAFAERPLKEAAEKLLFARAMGFAVPGPYWRNLRRIAATSLFCPKQIVAHKQVREQETSSMLQAINDASAPVAAAGTRRSIRVRSFLQRAAVNNMMRIVFGRRYDFGESCTEAEDLEAMIRDCFDVLGAFNWADHIPGLRLLDVMHVGNKCRTLVPRVKEFVQRIIDEHKSCGFERLDSEKDFVDVLLGLEGQDRLSDSDMISVLWEMIFRGTDTIAVLTEWALAEMVLHPEWQKKVQMEMDEIVGLHRTVEDADMEKLPSLQAILKETLRVHPPGPLLSWARLATEDVKLGGFDVPRGTTAMVNMWAITHDPAVWSNPLDFNPGRFMSSEGSGFDIRGGDLRLAPFGAGRRVCPGRSLGLATSHLWLARLLQQFSWTESQGCAVDLTEELKLSCEMAFPLQALPELRKDCSYVKS